MSTYLRTRSNSPAWISVALSTTAPVKYIRIFNRDTTNTNHLARLSPLQLWIGTSEADYNSGTSTRCGFANAQAGEPSLDLTVPVDTPQRPFSFLCSGPAVLLSDPTASSMLFNFESSDNPGWTTAATEPSGHPPPGTVQPYGWRRDSGGTPSGSTGPTSGYNGGTWYWYMEASSPRVNGDVFEISYDGSICNVVGFISFAYHMFGSNTGSLSVIAADGRTMWTRSGQQNTQPNWMYAEQIMVDSSGFTFRGTVGSGYAGDIAIDDVTVYCGGPAIMGSHVTLLLPGSSRSMFLAEIEVYGAPSPPPPPPPPSPPPPSPPPLPPGASNELFTFDTNSGVGWTTGPTSSSGQPTGSQPYGWHRKTGGTSSGGTGPNAGYNGEGKYYYIETSSPRASGDVYEISYGGTACTSGCVNSISFYYSMVGADIGTLSVIRSSDSMSVWSRTGQQSGDQNSWLFGSATVQAPGFLFRGTKGGSGYRGDIAIDHVTLHCHHEAC